MELITRKEIAKIFGVSLQTVKLWEKKNIIQPCCNVAGRPRYRKEDIERLIKPKNEGNAANDHN